MPIRTHSEVTPDTLRQMVHDGTLRAGDGVGVAGNFRSVVGVLISFVQRRALRDLDPAITASWLKWCASFTHWACIDGDTGISEMTRPHARFRTWEQLVGAHIVVRRPRYESDLRAYEVRDRMAIDAETAHDYPEHELLYYGVWLRKAWGKRVGLRAKAARLFEANSKHVCSARWVYQCQRSGVAVFQGEVPEHWYPARLAYDPTRLTTIMECTVVEKGTPG